MLGVLFTFQKFKFNSKKSGCKKQDILKRIG